MTKKEYLSQLSKYLAPLSESEKDEIVAEIDERFKVAKEKGETAKQVIEKLGTPEFLAQSYLKTEGAAVSSEVTGSQSAQSVPEKSHTGRKVLLALVLLGLNFFLVFWLWLGVFMTIGGMIFAALAFLFTGLMFMLAPALANMSLAIIPNLPPMLFFSGGLTVLLWSILAVLLLVWLSIWLIKLFIKYCKFNIELVKKV